MKILGSEITPYRTYLNRRKFIQTSIAATITSSLASNLNAEHNKAENQYLDHCRK